MEHSEASIPMYSLIPFIMMLGAIAVLPLIRKTHHWWEENKNKLLVSAVLGIPMTVWLIFNHMGHELAHTLIQEYIPFIILLGSLFVATGGIFVDGDIESKPLTNTTILAIGAILASIIGTTGAAMLLIRPLISSNKERNYKVHTILFFIAVVANLGGLLTPLGDPPLFLMYLKGASFMWFSSLTLEWLVANSIVLVIYFIVDSYMWKKETPEAKAFDHDNITPIKIDGKINFLFLVGIVLAVAFINDKTFSFINSHNYWGFLREGVMILMALLSLKMTKQIIRAKNHFNWEPIGEVAFLFIGIFITMVPALEFLRMAAPNLGISSPFQLYYATGFLSGFLDNAPTALTFYNVALGLPGTAEAAANGATMIAGIPEMLMKAICVGAVMFGSLTYIGNGPNFMVKAIAESQGIKMPDFFGYMYKFSIPVLVPVFILLQILFF